MRFLFRLAFWLGIVVFNLPAFDPQPPASEPKKAAGAKSAKAPKTSAQLSCAHNRQLCDPPARAIASLRDQPGDRPSRNPEKISQNTLKSSDLAPPWRGSK